MNTLRANYARLMKRYSALGKENVRLTESTLTLIQPINAQKTAYLFPVLENDTTNGLPPAADEIRLNINDEFIVGSIGLYLYGRSFNLENPLQTKKMVHTYAPNELNPAYNSVGDFYAGFLSVAVNKINYIDKWDIRKHEYVARTQWQKFFPADTNLPPQFNAVQGTQADKMLSEKGVYTAQPNFTLSGAKKNEVNIVLPNAISAATAQWTDNSGATQNIVIDKMAIVFRGLLAQNAARFQG